MKNKYRISGFIEEAGVVQLDIEADSKAQAKYIAQNEYDFDEIINISEL